MPTSAGPNSKGENSLVFAIDMADTRNSYKGQPVTNIWESGDPNGHGSILRKINTDKWLGKVIESGVVYHNIVNRRATTDSPDKTFFNNGGLNMGSMNFRTLNPATKYIQISFDYYGVEPYQRYCCPHLGLNGYLGISYTDGTTNTSGWDTTYSPGTGDDWNNLEENMGKWQRISLIATVDPNREPQGIWALYIYYDSLMGGEGYFANLMFSEHSSYPTGPVRFTSFERLSTEALLDLTKNKTIDLVNSSFDSNGEIIFDGTDDFIQVPYNATTEVITVEQVLKSPMTSRTCSFGLIENTDATSFYCFDWWIDPSDTMRVYTYDGSGYCDQGVQNSTIVSQNANKYFHLVVSKQESLLQVFVNGELIHSSDTWSNGGPPLPLTAEFARIGTRTSNGLTIQSWQGEIPITKVYNRGLSAEEVSANFEVIRKRFNI